MIEVSWSSRVASAELSSACEGAASEEEVSPSKQGTDAWKGLYRGPALKQGNTFAEVMNLQLREATAAKRYYGELGEIVHSKTYHM